MNKISASEQFDFAAWMTPGEAAELMGVTPHQARHLARTGAIEARQFGRAWMLKRAAVADYASREHRPGPRPQD